MKELLKLREEFEVVGDVRGKGLMLGLELVKSKVGHIRAAAGCIIRLGSYLTEVT